MRKKLLIMMLLMVTVGYLLSLSAKELLSDPLVVPLGSMEPIIDVTMAPGLILQYCDGHDVDLAVDIPDLKTRAKYKTKKYRDIREAWHWDKGGIRIFRTYLASHEDAVSLVYNDSVAGRSLNALPFPGWADKKDIGDKTYWYNCHCVCFVKGIILVTVDVTCFSNNVDEIKAFTRRIAESVERKL
jgi:hypothetical protein